MIAIKLPQGFCRRALHLEQVLAKSKTGGRLSQRALVGGESSGVERTHGGEQLSLGLDTDAAVIDQRGLPALGISGVRGQQQDQDSDERERVSRVYKISDELTPNTLETRCHLTNLTGQLREFPRGLKTLSEGSTKSPSAAKAALNHRRSRHDYPSCLRVKSRALTKSVATCHALPPLQSARAQTLMGVFGRVKAAQETRVQANRSGQEAIRGRAPR
jgi:hypothetical protein